MSTAGAVQAALLELLGSLPKDANPYDAIAEYLRNLLFPTVPYGAICQLYLLAAALGIAALLIVASLVTRWIKGVFWIVRLQQQPRMVRPHWSISWSCIAFVMLVFLEVFIGYATEFFDKQPNPRFGCYFLLPWMFAWWGGQTAAWSLLVSYILHQYASSGRSGRSVSMLAIASNVFGLGMPLVYIGGLLPFVVTAGRAYNAGLHVFLNIDALLAQASAQWSPGQAVNLVALAPALPHLQALVDHFEVFLRYFRITFIYYCASAILLVICLVSIAAVYLVTLRKVLVTTREELSATQESSTFVRRPQQAQIQRTLRSLLLTIISFSFLGVVFAFTAILAAISPQQLITSPLRAQLLILLPLYAFAVFGLPAPSSSSSAHATPAPPKKRAAKTRTPHRRGGSAAAGQQFSIQLTHLDSGEAFPPSALSAVAAGPELGALEARDPLGGVKVAVDVSVAVDDEDDLDEKFAPRGGRGAEV